MGFVITIVALICSSANHEYGKVSGVSTVSLLRLCVSRVNSFWIFWYNFKLHVY